MNSSLKTSNCHAGKHVLAASLGIFVHPGPGFGPTYSEKWLEKCLHKFRSNLKTTWSRLVKYIPPPSAWELNINYYKLDLRYLFLTLFKAPFGPCLWSRDPSPRPALRIYFGGEEFNGLGHGILTNWLLDVGCFHGIYNKFHVFKLFKTIKNHPKSPKKLVVKNNQTSGGLWHCFTHIIEDFQSFDHWGFHCQGSVFTTWTWLTRSILTHCKPI